MPKKNKPTPWTLRPGDALPERILGERPELAGMEDHAVFRMLLFQQRIGMPPAWRQVAFFAIVLGFIAAMNVLPRLLRTNIPLMILCILLLTTAYVFTLLFISKPGLLVKLTGRTLTVPVLSRLTAQNIVDLTLAGIGPRDYLPALWASFLRSDASRNRRRVCLVLLAAPLLVFPLGSLMPQLNDTFTWFFVYFAFFAGQMCFMARHPVPVAFNFACQVIRQSRRKFIRAHGGFSRRILVYILLVSMLPGLTIVVLKFTQYSLPAMTGTMLACLVCGALAGRMLVGDFRAGFEKSHDRALEDLEVILNRVRDDLDKLPAQLQS